MVCLRASHTQYRALVDFKNPAWFMPRIADKFMFAFVITTLYLQTGDDLSQVGGV
jgi:hypothetical protein